jgi:hypothetical protein
MSDSQVYGLTENLSDASNICNGGTSTITTTKEGIMPVAELDKAALSAVVNGFTLAIIEVCQTLEHQRTLPLTPIAFIGEMELRAKNLPNDPNNKIQKNILMNIANGLKGEPLAPFQFP